MAQGRKTEPADATGDAVRRAQAGERTAFDELYEAHVGRVYALCLRMTADPGLAAELVQDVFVRAWRRIGTFRHAAAFSSWLHRVTVNVVLDAQKRRRRRPAQLSTVPDEALAGGADPATGDPVGRLALERALASLPDRARTALVLHAIEGYRYEEVAGRMGITVGAVKSHIHRARALLLERLEAR
ncbi:MAG: sigma-70 family RNA polymerase sigma factor [Gemmatimonadetes bacterium]|nr:sigma-70 family RNA polymerase sigma factor [Gemmatimonadota bacterium]NIQ54025.1 sigma-70 family RNA polymerase sigma factor [Gemmatimonadota bacterium]NIU74209.1 sigma-70 family RNA polymerase sigma factor [Gammaproteobacteria bacterium]NIX44240.1 sigma-70 family RNA polymerase sigma factor [Gemmatimonadota bacterium]NIY08463.1 sigma-70 family RNA polymerase sigma factor [Gemmatimonadota bacterium]